MMMMKKPWGLVFVLGVCKLLLWSSKNHSSADAYIGINWGRGSTQRLMPSMVVDLLMQNEIQHVRIFQQSNNVLEAFYNTGIAVSFGLANTLLDGYLNKTNLDWWIQEKILRYESVMEIEYVSIGSQPFDVNVGNRFFSVVEVLKNVQNRLNSIGRSHIKASTPHYYDVLTWTNSTFKPSEADFRPDIKDKMVEHVRFLGESKAPFMLTLHPIHFVNNNSLELEFAFMDNKSSYSVRDINATYTNAFELLYDSLHWALSKAGAGGVNIMISAIGWPTDSYRGANVENAQRFYKGFLPYIAKGVGSPMRPNRNIDVFLHTLSDETRQLAELGWYQRHWGIYKFDGEAKYMIDFSGQGRDVFPATAKGVIYMPNRWCVFNGDMKDPAKVAEMKAMACNVSDCSSMESAGSCSNLTNEQQVSYAFNRYYQTNQQESQSSNEVCNMKGLGMVVTVDPSTGTCEFPIEILSAEIAVQGATFGDSGADSVHGWVYAPSGLLVLVNVFWMII